MALGAGCSVGRGEGELRGTVDVEDCPGLSEYHLRPTFFGAEPVDALLEIRVQRGSGAINVVDGIYVLVRDASELQAHHLGEELLVDNDEGPVGVTLFLNSSCPPSRSRSPVTLPAVSGRVRFDSIYAPLGDDSDVQISAELLDVQFVDPRNEQRNAQISGYFSFLFERGRPAQLFP
jgi:hypothetical protein